MKYYVFVISIIIATISIESTLSQEVLQLSNSEAKDLLNLPESLRIESIQNDATDKWNQLFPGFQNRGLARAARDNDLVKTIKKIATFLPLTLLRTIQWIVQTYSDVSNYFVTSIKEILNTLAKQLESF